MEIAKFGIWYSDSIKKTIPPHLQYVTPITFEVSSAPNGTNRRNSCYTLVSFSCTQIANSTPIINTGCSKSISKGSILGMKKSISLGLQKDFLTTLYDFSFKQQRASTSQDVMPHDLVWARRTSISGSGPARASDLIISSQTFSFHLLDSISKLFQSFLAQGARCLPAFLRRRVTCDCRGSIPGGVSACDRGLERSKLESSLFQKTKKLKRKEKN